MLRRIVGSAVVLVLCAGGALAAEYSGTLTGLDNDGKSIKVKVGDVVKTFPITETTVFHRQGKGEETPVPKKELVRISRELATASGAGPRVQVTTTEDRGKERLVKVLFTGPAR